MEMKDDRTTVDGIAGRWWDIQLDAVRAALDVVDDPTREFMLSRLAGRLDHYELAVLAAAVNRLLKD